MRPSEERERRLRRGGLGVLRTLARGVAALVVAGGLALAAGWVWLQSPAGGAWLLGRILPRVNESISGHLAVRSLRVVGLRYDAHGLELRTASGRVVATADGLAGLDLVPLLLHGQLALRDARLRGLEIDAAVAVGGVDALEALAPPKAQAGSGEGDGGGQGGSGENGLVLRNLAVELRSLHLTQRASGALPDSVVLGAGEGRIARTSSGAPVEITLAAAMRRPVSGPFRIAAELGGAGPGRSVTAELPGVRADARFTRSGHGMHVRWTLEATPDGGRSLVAGWPLALALRASGAIRSGEGPTSFEASAAAGDARLQARGELGGAPALVAHLDFERLDVGALLGSGPRTALHGSAALRARREGEEVRASIDARLAPGAIAQARFGSAVVHVAGSRRRVRAELEVASLRAAGHAVRRLHARAALTRGTTLVASVDAAQLGSARIAARYASGVARVGALRVQVGTSRWTLASPARLRLRGGRISGALALRSGGQHLAVAGAGDRGSVDATVRVRRVRLETLPVQLPVTGTVSGSAALTGRWSSPSVTARVQLRAAAPGAGPFTAAIALHRSRDGVVRASGRLARGSAPRFAARFQGSLRPAGEDQRFEATLEGDPSGRVEVEGRIRRAAGRWRVAADATASAFDPAPLAALLRPVRSVTGVIDGHAHVEAGGSGPATIVGTLRWRDGTLATRGFGLYRGIDVALSGDPRSVTIERLEATSGDGHLVATGHARPVAGGVAVTLDARTDRFPAVWGWRYLARVSGRVAVAGTATARGGEVVATFSQSSLRLPRTLTQDVQEVRRPDDVVVLERGEERVPAEGQPPAWRLRIVTPEPVDVQGPSFAMALAVSDPFVVDLGPRTRIFGTLRVTRGTFDVVGAGLRVLAGSELRFTGPPDAPFVDVGAASTVDGGMEIRATTDPAGVRWQVAASRRAARRLPGQAQRHRPLQNPRESRVDPDASALARWVTAQIPFAALFDPGLATGTGDVRSRITGRLEVGAVTRPAADPTQGEEPQRTRVGMRIAPDVQIEARFGAQTGSADVLWTPRLGGGGDRGDERNERR